MTIEEAVLSVLEEESRFDGFVIQDNDVEFLTADVQVIINDPRTQFLFEECETLEEFPIALIENGVVIPEMNSTIPHMAYVYLSSQ